MKDIIDVVADALDSDREEVITVSCIAIAFLISAIFAIIFPPFPVSNIFERVFTGIILGPVFLLMSAFALVLIGTMSYFLVSSIIKIYKSYKKPEEEEVES